MFLLPSPLWYNLKMPCLHLNGMLVCLYFNLRLAWEQSLHFWWRSKQASRKRTPYFCVSFCVQLTRDFTQTENFSQAGLHYVTSVKVALSNGTKTINYFPYCKASGHRAKIIGQVFHLTVLMQMYLYQQFKKGRRYSSCMLSNNCAVHLRVTLYTVKVNGYDTLKEGRGGGGVQTFCLPYLEFSYCPSFSWLPPLIRFSISKY